MGQLLQYGFAPPPYYAGHTELDGYMAKQFVKGIQEIFDAEKLKEDDRGQILVGFRGRLFDIDGENYQVEEEVGGYNAIGSGTDLALGAMYATRDRDIPPESRIEVALRAAADHNATIRGPFYIESI
jgi:ATP-dependent protease HslVU (ClpYQ) peptidase subunit